jgi:chromosome partitioning protein
MIILLASQKGGAGKSTIAINIADYLDNPLIVDADKQANLVNSEFNGRFKVATTYDNIKKDILAYKKKHKNIIIDVAGRDSPELRSGLLVADIAIIPFIPSQLDLSTLDTLTAILAKAKKLNKKLKCFAVINNANPYQKHTVTKDAKEFIKDNSKIKVLDTVLHTRASYRYVFIKNKTIRELTDKKAKAEIDNLIKELNL